MTTTQEIYIEELANGVTVIIEEIPQLESVAYEVSIPGGITTDAEGFEGSSLLLAELTSRGAGGLDSRALSDAFDSRGIRHSESAALDRFIYRGALLADYLGEALQLTALMLRQPHLPEVDVDNIKSLLVHDLKSLMDNPAKRVMIELARKYYPAPYGRSVYGEAAGIAACHHKQQRLDWENRFGAQGSFVSVAGKCKIQEVIKLVRRSFGDWKGVAESPPAFSSLPGPLHDHIDFDSAQLQIGLAFPSAHYLHPQYYIAKVLNQVLSGGMFGRLFTEVREKRGLCYHVQARHSATRDYGTVSIYAGTTPERAQETLNVILHELKGVHGTLAPEELVRAKANLKAALVIGEESSSARASSNAHDWWLGRRVRTFEEILDEINCVTEANINSHLEDFPAKGYSSLTLGSKALEGAAL